jgi:predicted O-methyltransferase YrrM
MNFSADGCTQRNIEHIISILGLPKVILELGVYEGNTTFWMAELLNRFFHEYTYYAVDPHEGSVDLSSADFNIIRDNFVYNLNAYGKDNIKYLSTTSTDALIQFKNAGTYFDLVYVDGDHRASQVLTDLVLSWECIRPGGVILCDDANDWKFTDSNNSSPAQMSPRMAIETFIMCNWDRLKIIKLPDSAQTAFIKVV